MGHTTLYWLGQDLRLHDNPALQQAKHNTDRLLFVYCIDPNWFKPKRYHNAAVGKMRWQFMVQCLNNLHANLCKQQQQLLIFHGSPVGIISQLISQHQVSRVVRSRQVGIDEQRQWQRLTAHHPDVFWREEDGATLYDLAQLPFAINDCPKTMADFLLQVDPLAIAAPLLAPATLPPSTPHSTVGLQADTDALSVIGGENDGLRHLAQYFESEQPNHYHSQCDALQGWHNSSKLSLWLGQGCISPRQSYAAISQYQTLHNDSDNGEALKQALLRREYWQWYGLSHGDGLFKFAGSCGQRPLTSFYSNRFTAWCHGNSGYPIVDAAMRELLATGYISNRARQLAASCLVHQLQVDWRYGAAWFEHHLLDYDCGSNWGNWQHIAGVSSDPDDGKPLDLQQQSERFDPEHRYRRRWQSEATPLTASGELNWQQ
ncbi:DASH family cryptochrome [uncultured Ferrimonas sp.]|uniref:DASH family cryptochrome n=1 Tax=uncultured Ferrimonas sp. TaxID=432640 RepID=UPI00260D153B|nr:DASH family cryptochrome [uncultured Ferrimonas sp.]